MTAVFIAIFAALALFAASALVILLITGERSTTEVRLAELRSRHAASDDTEASDQFRVQNLLSFLTRPLAPFRNWLRSHDEELSYRLSLAGYRKPEDADTFLSFKLLGPVVGILLATFGGAGNFLLYALILGVTGFFAPDIFLFNVVGRRKVKISMALPDALDLMVICMQAGLGIDQAVLRIATEIKLVYPQLSEELLLIGHEQRAGKPRLDAWRSMADRVDVDTVRQFVAMLAQTDRLGTPISQSLGTFADSLRTQRLLRAEENAAKTTVKLLFPLIAFIFPALFVVLLGPAAITISKTFEELGK
jgi:tight adherence protein C